jgi:hypothetical protein|eukprot:SAG25_NODE_853_length_5069_cov_10.802012_4_plen_90_part_00
MLSNQYTFSVFISRTVASSHGPLIVFLKRCIEHKAAGHAKVSSSTDTMYMIAMNVETGSSANTDSMQVKQAHCVWISGEKAFTWRHQRG